MQKLPNMPQKVGKPKSYPLVGEVDMADELNKIEASRPKGYRGSAIAKPATFNTGAIATNRYSRYGSDVEWSVGANVPT